uniref:PPFIA binding protein 2 n=1 Tax=Scleropages formosus TaxID=113540 RepID=A0A8C9SN13_SCLFO
KYLAKGYYRHPTTLVMGINHRSPVNNESYQERLSRLEGDKESLVLQVSVLTDQVEAQGEKIRDLETSLEEHHHKLSSTEEMLQQELLSRTSLETQKLDLMDEVSYLKLKLVGMEEAQSNGEDKQHKAEGLLQELRQLKNKVDELEGEKSQYEQKLKATKAEIAELQHLLAAKDAEIECLQSQLLSKSPVCSDSAERGTVISASRAWSVVQHRQKRIHCLLLTVVWLLTFALWAVRWRISRPPPKLKRNMTTLTISGTNYDKFKLNLFCTPTGRTQKTDDPASSDLSPVSSGVDSWQQSPVSPENKKNQKGIKKFWGKIRRTQSGSLPRDDLEPTEFRRGGLRATAGPRLACTSDGGSSVRYESAPPFLSWTKEQVCGWLEDYGLGQYVNLARQWVNSGETLLSATPQDFEKEMGIKHPLHRKKLQLAVRSFSTKVIEKSADLDHIWVTRWLDDIGLPQYKDQFNEARVDGRMLQYLTLNDLLFLKVTSQLHHLSIKSAIHVLHINKFNPNCLRRRPGDENKTSPTEVTQWSNHRVMEWLRSVDLAEYAPNLRGSGVHGGLIILEPRFNSDALAMLLNIPPQKTLLRRHLATNFNALVGTQAQQEKRQHMESSGYVPLTTTAKVRPKKLGFSSFGHLRKKKLDDSMDYICPMDPCQPALNGALRPYSGFRGLSPIFDRDAEKLEQVGQKI